MMRRIAHNALILSLLLSYGATYEFKDKTMRKTTEAFSADLDNEEFRLHEIVFIDEYPYSVEEIMNNIHDDAFKVWYDNDEYGVAEFLQGKNKDTFRIKKDGEFLNVYEIGKLFGAKVVSYVRPTEITLGDNAYLIKDIIDNYAPEMADQFQVTYEDSTEVIKHNGRIITPHDFYKIIFESDKTYIYDHTKIMLDKVMLVDQQLFNLLMHIPNIEIFYKGQMYSVGEFQKIHTSAFIGKYKIFYEKPLNIKEIVKLLMRYTVLNQLTTDRINLSLDEVLTSLKAVSGLEIYQPDLDLRKPANQIDKIASNSMQLLRFGKLLPLSDVYTLLHTEGLLVLGKTDLNLLPGVEVLYQDTEYSVEDFKAKYGDEKVLYRIRKNGNILNQIEIRELQHSQAKVETISNHKINFARASDKATLMTITEAPTRRVFPYILKNDILYSPQQSLQFLTWKNPNNVKILYNNSQYEPNDFLHSFEHIPTQFSLITDNGDNIPNEEAERYIVYPTDNCDNEEDKILFKGQLYPITQFVHLIAKDNPNNIKFKHGNRIIDLQDLADGCKAVNPALDIIYNEDVLPFLEYDEDPQITTEFLAPTKGPEVYTENISDNNEQTTTISSIDDYLTDKSITASKNGMENIENLQEYLSTESIPNLQEYPSTESPKQEENPNYDNESENNFESALTTIVPLFSSTPKEVLTPSVNTRDGSIEYKIPENGHTEQPIMSTNDNEAKCSDNVPQSPFLGPTGKASYPKLPYQYGGMNIPNIPRDAAENIPGFEGYPKTPFSNGKIPPSFNTEPKLPYGSYPYKHDQYPFNVNPFEPKYNDRPIVPNSNRPTDQVANIQYPEFEEFDTSADYPINENPNRGISNQHNNGPKQPLHPIGAQPNNNNQYPDDKNPVSQLLESINKPGMYYGPNANQPTDQEADIPYPEFDEFYTSGKYPINKNPNRGISNQHNNGPKQPLHPIGAQPNNNNQYPDDKNPVSQLLEPINKPGMYYGPNANQPTDQEADIPYPEFDEFYTSGKYPINKNPNRGISNQHNNGPKQPLHPIGAQPNNNNQYPDDKNPVSQLLEPINKPGMYYGPNANQPTDQEADIPYPEFDEFYTSGKYPINKNPNRGISNQHNNGPKQPLHPIGAQPNNNNQYPDDKNPVNQLIEPKNNPGMSYGPSYSQPDAPNQPNTPTEINHIPNGDYSYETDQYTASNNSPNMPEGSNPKPKIGTPTRTDESLDNSSNPYKSKPKEDTPTYSGYTETPGYNYRDQEDSLNSEGLMKSTNLDFPITTQRYPNIGSSTLQPHDNNDNLQNSVPDDKVDEGVKYTKPINKTRDDDHKYPYGSNPNEYYGSEINPVAHKTPTQTIPTPESLPERTTAINIHPTLSDEQNPNSWHSDDDDSDQPIGANQVYSKPVKPQYPEKTYQEESSTEFNQQPEISEPTNSENYDVVGNNLDFEDNSEAPNYLYRYPQTEVTRNTNPPGRTDTGAPNKNVPNIGEESTTEFGRYPTNKQPNGKYPYQTNNEQYPHGKNPTEKFRPEFQPEGGYKLKLPYSPLSIDPKLGDSVFPSHDETDGNDDVPKYHPHTESSPIKMTDSTFGTEYKPRKPQRENYMPGMPPHREAKHPYVENSPLGQHNMPTPSDAEWIVPTRPQNYNGEKIPQDDEMLDDILYGKVPNINFQPKETETPLGGSTQNDLGANLKPEDNDKEEWKMTPFSPIAVDDDEDFTSMPPKQKEPTVEVMKISNPQPVTPIDDSSFQMPEMPEMPKMNHFQTKPVDDFLFHLPEVNNFQTKPVDGPSFQLPKMPKVDSFHTKLMDDSSFQPPQMPEINNFQTKPADDSSSQIPKMPNLQFIYDDLNSQLRPSKPPGYSSPNPHSQNHRYPGYSPNIRPYGESVNKFGNPQMVLQNGNVFPFIPKHHMAGNGYSSFKPNLPVYGVETPVYQMNPYNMEPKLQSVQTSKSPSFKQNNESPALQWQVRVPVPHGNMNFWPSPVYGADGKPINYGQGQYPFNVPGHQGQYPFNVPEYQRQYPFHVPGHQRQYPFNVPEYQGQYPFNVPGHQSQAGSNFQPGLDPNGVRLPKHPINIDKETMYENPSPRFKYAQNEFNSRKEHETQPQKGNNKGEPENGETDVMHFNPKMEQKSQPQKGTNKGEMDMVHFNPKMEQKSQPQKENNEGELEEAGMMHYKQEHERFPDVIYDSVRYTPQQLIESLAKKNPFNLKIEYGNKIYTPADLLAIYNKVPTDFDFMNGNQYIQQSDIPKYINSILSKETLTQVLNRFPSISYKGRVYSPKDIVEKLAKDNEYGLNIKCADNVYNPLEFLEVFKKVPNTFELVKDNQPLSTKNLLQYVKI